MQHKHQFSFFSIKHLDFFFLNIKYTRLLKFHNKMSSKQIPDNSIW